MKKKFILIPLIGTLIYTLLTGYAAGPGITDNLERTGASGTVGCGGAGCHSSASSTPPTTTISIQLLSGATPVTTYTGGGSYTIKITGTQTSATLTLPKFGFQVAAVKTSTTTNAGTLLAVAGTHTVTPTPSGVNLVEHSAPITATTGTGASGTTYVISIPWTAPVAGTGSVSIFAVLNAVNNNGSADAGDKWNNTSLVVPEASVAGVSPITGTLSVCAGATTTLADATMSGTWSSSSTATATVNSGGTVTGVAPGTVTITYTVAGSGSATATVTVNPSPAAIGGPSVVCQESTITLTDATAGGTWSSGSAATATVSATGVVTGVAAGTTGITYTLAAGCSASATVTVNAGPAPITGNTNLCRGATDTLGDITPGGIWSSSATTIATIGTAGIVSGVSAGIVIITYTQPGGCYDTMAVAVDTLGGLISGPSIVCVGSTVTLTESEPGGTWSSASTAHATVGSATGIVTGVAVGTDTIKYTVTGVCGTGTAKRVMTIHAAGTCVSGVAAVAGSTTNELKVYPNPAQSGNFTVSLSSDIDEDVRIVITNIVGERVKEFTIKTNNSTDVRLGLTPGIYFLNAFTAHERYVARVVVE